MKKKSRLKAVARAMFLVAICFLFLACAPEEEKLLDVEEIVLRPFTVREAYEMDHGYSIAPDEYIKSFISNDKTKSDPDIMSRKFYLVRVVITDGFIYYREHYYFFPEGSPTKKINSVCNILEEDRDNAVVLKMRKSFKDKEFFEYEFHLPRGAFLD